MKDVPVWLTPGITALALIVSVVSMLIALATYRRQGSKVRGGIRIAKPATEDQDLPITLTLTNDGFQAIQVLRVTLGYGGQLLHIPIFPFANSDIHEGPNLPYLLQGNTTATWIFSPEAAWPRRRQSAPYLPDSPWPYLTTEGLMEELFEGPYGLKGSLGKWTIIARQFSIAVNLGNGNVFFPFISMTSDRRLCRWWLAKETQLLQSDDED